MDNTTEKIANYTAGLSFEGLSDQCRSAAKLRVLDTVACAWGAVNAEPVTIAKRALLTEGGAEGNSRVIGGGLASAETAAFVNSLMSRYLDFNDWAYPAGHPTDMILPLFAVAEEAGADGAAVLPVLVAAFQVYDALSNGGRLSQHGWDVGIALSAATAAGSARLFGLGPEGIGSALAIAVSCGPALSVRAAGSRVSMWKAGSGPQACKTGVFSALLARAGMTGPDAPFEGRNGFFQRVSDEFDVDEFLTRTDPYRIEETVIKLFPAEIHAQAPIAAALDLRKDIEDVQQIEHIDIQVYARAKMTVGGEEKWNPETRETADHSCPYAVSVALLDGVVNSASFDEENLHRPDVRELMSKISIEENAQLTARYPEEFTNEFTVSLRDGSTVRKVIHHPLGHPKNPADPEAIDQKIQALVAGRLTDVQLAELKAATAGLEQLSSMAAITGICASSAQ